MKCIAIILITVAVAAVMSNPMPDGAGDDVCHDTVKPVIEGFCTGKDQTTCFGCVFSKCHTVYEADKANCNGIKECINNSGC